MNAPASIPVIVIGQKDFWAIEQPDLMVELFDAVDEAVIFDIMGKIQPSSVIIIESDVFQGCEIPMRIFLRQIRMQKGEAPRILVLRCKNLGKENPTLAEGDKQAGATDVLWYQLSTLPKELTGKIGSFIRNGAISIPRASSRRTPVKSNPTTRVSCDALVAPAKTTSERDVRIISPLNSQRRILPPAIPQSDLPLWFSRPGMKSGESDEKQSGATGNSLTGTASIDAVSAGGNHLPIALLGHTLIFRQRHLAERFSHITKNGSTTTPFLNIAKSSASALAQLSSLRRYLDTLRPGLGKCIVSDRGIGAHFNSNIFLSYMNKKD